MEKVKEFLKQVYNTTVEEVKINELQDAINCTNDFYDMTGEEEYIDLAYDLQNILELKMEIEDNEFALQLERQVL